MKERDNLDRAGDANKLTRRRAITGLGRNSLDWLRRWRADIEESREALRWGRFLSPEELEKRGVETLPVDSEE